jgi:hypothetical protein
VAVLSSHLGPAAPEEEPPVPSGLLAEWGAAAAARNAGEIDETLPDDKFDAIAARVENCAERIFGAAGRQSG